MLLKRIEKHDSPGAPGNARITGHIITDAGDAMEIWVDVPQALAPSLSDTGNPWLVAMLPMAAAKRESIRIDAPVDRLLLENLKGVTRVWSAWYPELAAVAFECTPVSAAASEATKTAGFFSGGIDSYFTLARHLPGNRYGLPAVGQIDELLTVQGFDISVHDDASFAPMQRALGEIAQEVGRAQFVIRTNLRDNQSPWMRRWGPLTHAAGLAFVGLALEKRYRRVMFGSAYPLAKVVPWGSHPMLDPYFSSASLQIVHDGAPFTRVEKTELVGRFPPAMSFLHVCQAEGTRNCARCEKCYRTMITLDLLGLKDAAKSIFDWSDYGLETIKRLYVKPNNIMFEEILAAAGAAGRADLVRALTHAARRSSYLGPVIRLGESLERIPGMWRAGGMLKNAVLKHTVSEHYISHQ